MHKRLLILGLLLGGPLTGYDLHRVIAAHGELYRDLKKPNLYYLLDRMAQERLLEMKTETGARGRRGERLVYSITSAGRAQIVDLLREVLTAYEPIHSGVDVAIVLLDQLPKRESASLLKQRLDQVIARRQQISLELGQGGREPGSAGDHLLALVDAEARWLKRAISRIQASSGRTHAPKT
ncbi:MAG TPA: PadR family transcriptional regulator [Candidatus Dormibacteraeota bacterium]